MGVVVCQAVVPDVGIVESSAAPQEVRCPTKATGLPWTFTLELPSTITHSWRSFWPHRHRSPMRATPLSATFDDSLAVMTRQPRSVWSPSRMTPRIVRSLSQTEGIRTVILFRPCFLDRRLGRAHHDDAGHAVRTAVHGGARA